MIKNPAASIRFARPTKESFRAILTKRVRAYFEENDKSNKANAVMVIKTIGMLALYFVPYALLYTLGTNALAVIGLYIVMGFGMSGIGMSVMHDAIHGAYSKSRRLNKILGSTIYLISGNAATWRIQHNVLHHTFTNIEGLDEDMESSGLLRLHPSQPHKRMYKYQKWYAPFVYGLLTLNWVVAKDFKQLVKYYRAGHAGNGEVTIRKEWTTLVITKTIYFALFIVLPLIFVPTSWYWVLLGFASMHFVAGIVLSYVFQLAHMVENIKTLDRPESGLVEDEWMEHQLATTANFARKNWLVNWFVGGLNFQVEHHLFPNICHIHYPQIAEIVRKTALEFGLPYQEYKHMRQALAAHNRHLDVMGLG